MEIAQSVETIVDTKSAPAGKVLSSAKADPYLNFNVDIAKVARVNTFIDSVQKMEQVDQASEKLTSEDMKLEVVQETMKNFSSKTKFEKLHSLK